RPRRLRLRRKLYLRHQLRSLLPRSPLLRGPRPRLMAKKRVLGVPAKLPHGYSVVSVRDCGWQYHKDKMAHFARRGHIAKNFAWVWEPDFCWAVNGAGDSVIVLRRSNVFSLYTLISCNLHTICPTHSPATVFTAANYYNPHVARLVHMLAPTGMQWAMLHPYHYESISP